MIGLPGRSLLSPNGSARAAIRHSARLITSRANETSTPQPSHPRTFTLNKLTQVIFGSIIQLARTPGGIGSIKHSTTCVPNNEKVQGK